MVRILVECLPLICAVLNFLVTLGTFELLVLLDQCLNIHIKIYFSYLYLTACRIMLSSILYFVEWTDYDTHNSCHGTCVIVQSACRNVPTRRGTLIDNYCMCVCVCVCVCFVESTCHLTHAHVASLLLLTTLVFCRINLSPHTRSRCVTPVDNYSGIL